MIATMLDIDKTKESILLVVIEQDNLVRMENADPVSLESIKRGGMLPAPKYPGDLSILIAYEKDDAELYRRVREESVVDLLYWLERGRVYIEGVDGKNRGFTIRKDISSWTLGSEPRGH
jgi:hypothetical protein